MEIFFFYRIRATFGIIASARRYDSGFNAQRLMTRDSEARNGLAVSFNDRYIPMATGRARGIDNRIKLILKQTPPRLRAKFGIEVH